MEWDRGGLPVDARRRTRAQACHRPSGIGQHVEHRYRSKIGQQLAPRDAHVW
jgi:hypothetical protein